MNLKTSAMIKIGRANPHKQQKRIAISLSDKSS